eukprot:959318-Rhodomonas_salina.1
MACVPCTGNTFKAALANSACQPCHSGSQTDETRTLCQCRPGYAAYSGPASCQLCPQDTWKDVFGDQMCQLCPPHSGTMHAGAASMDVCLCGAGYNGTAASGCEPVPAGVFKEGMGPAQAFQPCPANSHGQPGAASVAECLCNAGYTRAGDTCVPCAAGSYKVAAGNVACVRCPTPRTSHAGASTLAECVCGPGFLGNDVCTPCPTDSYCLGFNVQVPCPNTTGTPQEGASKLADCLCVPGYFTNGSASGAAVCVPCGVDTFTNKHGSGTCALCADVFMAAGRITTCGLKGQSVCLSPEDELCNLAGLPSTFSLLTRSLLTRPLLTRSLLTVLTVLTP